MIIYINHLIEKFRFNLFKWMMKYFFKKEHKYIVHTFEDITNEVLKKNPIYTVIKELQRYWIMDEHSNLKMLHTFINAILVSEKEDCMEVELYTERPGMNIGTKGCVIDNIETTLSELFEKKTIIKIKERKIEV